MMEKLNEKIEIIGTPSGKLGAFATNAAVPEQQLKESESIS